MRSESSPKLKFAAGQRPPDIEVVDQQLFVSLRLYDTPAMLTVGRFRAIVFAGSAAVDHNNLSESAVAIETIARRLDGLFDVIVIAMGDGEGRVGHELPQRLVEVGALYGDKAGEGSCHEAYGVNVEKGAVVIVRPDGWIGCCADVGDREAVETYFDGFLVAN